MTSLVFTNTKQNNIWYKNTLIYAFIIVTMSQLRYVVRVLGVPTSYTKETFEQELVKQDVLYKSVWLATSSNGVCAGFAFVEFSCEHDMNVFIARYPLGLSHLKDVIWSSKVDKI